MGQYFKVLPVLFRSVADFLCGEGECTAQAWGKRALLLSHLFFYECCKFVVLLGWFSLSSTGLPGLPLSPKIRIYDVVYYYYYLVKHPQGLHYQTKFGRLFPDWWKLWFSFLPTSLWWWPILRSPSIDTVWPEPINWPMWTDALLVCATEIERSKMISVMIEITTKSLASLTGRHNYDTLGNWVDK